MRELRAGRNVWRQDTPMIQKSALSLALTVSIAACRAPEGTTGTRATSHRHGELEGPVEVTTPASTRIREFHGHVGPYVVLGYRMGLAARRVLSSPGYFDLTAHVETPLVPPPSCLIDGLQLGSGCTTGKRNLTVAEGTIARCFFTSKSGGQVTIALRPDLPEKMRAWIAESGTEATGLKVLDLPEEELFSLEETSCLQEGDG